MMDSGLQLFSKFADQSRLHWYTIKHLRPVQFYGRFWFRIAGPKPGTSPPPRLRAVTGDRVVSACRAPSMTGKGNFRLLGESGSLAADGWDSPTRDKLWRYNQHYFDDLNAQGANERGDLHEELIENWIEENPPGLGTGWEPYPTSLRIANWVKWALSGAVLTPEAIQSLAVQVRWLTKRLEWHLLGNHLFANAKALIFAGLYFKGTEADAWLRKGLKILRRELPRQFLEDGGQFELSPMYHSLALEDLLDLINVSRTHKVALSSEHLRQLDAWERLVPNMLNWLNTMCHPDGEIAFFNDAATGIAPSPSELFAYADRLGFETVKEQTGSMILFESGYFRLSNATAILLADVARVGPDHLLAHAHADTLSFEFSMFGQRLIVNSGTSVYGLGSERLRQRGTSAHNTVLIDGEDSSEVWSGFRVARRAYPYDVRYQETDKTFLLEASHDGYKRLKGKPVHTRRWELSPNKLKISDHVPGKNSDAQARYHIHPDVRVEASDDRSGFLVLPAGQRISWRAEGGSVTLEDTTWHPEFGVSIPNKCIVLPLCNGAATLEL
jgi:uncharacterized heparinase superfamily protein